MCIPTSCLFVVFVFLEVQPNKPIGFSVDATSISQHLSTFTWTAPGAFHSDFKYYIEYQSEWRESGATPVNVSIPELRTHAANIPYVAVFS